MFGKDNEIVTLFVFLHEDGVNTVVDDSKYSYVRLLDSFMAKEKPYRIGCGNANDGPVDFMLKIKEDKGGVRSVSRLMGEIGYRDGNWFYRNSSTTFSTKAITGSLETVLPVNDFRSPKSSKIVMENITVLEYENDTCTLVFIPYDVFPGLKCVKLIQGQTYVLGRSNDCDIVINNPSVGRRHASVRLNAGWLELMDLNSTNGTYIKGNRVPTGGYVALNNKDVFTLYDVPFIRLGDMLFYAVEGVQEEENEI